MIVTYMLRPDYHKNEGSTLLSKIIFDCATKAGIECTIKDGFAHYGVIPQGHMCTMHRHRISKDGPCPCFPPGTCPAFCTAYLDNTRLTIDFRLISAYLAWPSMLWAINPKFWHILVRPDSLDCKYEVDINDPKAFNELVELFVALRPISNLKYPNIS